MLTTTSPFDDFSILPIVTCRHHDVEWRSTHTCRCRSCGKTGVWYEEGFVLWCRRRPGEMELPPEVRVPSRSDEPPHPLSIDELPIRAAAS